MAISPFNSSPVSKTIRSSTMVLSLGCAFVLSACNNAGSELESAGLTTPVPVASKDARKAAFSRLAARLNAQNRDLTAQNASASAVDVTKLRPVAEPQAATRLAVLRPPKPTRTVEEAIAPPPGDETPRVETQQAAFGPLGRFHRKLAALRSGQRTKPVTIVHIGDSHVASDSFSRGIRSVLQARYGNAGRGAVIPAKAFKYGVADQVKLEARGNWRSKTALRNKQGPFGLSGVSVTSRSSRSTMKLTSNRGTFDWAEVTVLSGPSQGPLVMRVGDKTKQFDAYSKTRGAKTFRLEHTGRTLQVNPGGGAQTTVLNWATGKKRPGIRYVNFGLIGATVNITRRFDSKLVSHDISRLEPDLIIYGYGTNEGFNDRLDLKAYRRTASGFVKRLRKAAPQADLVFIGAASGLRRKGNRACGGWSVPRRLAPLRKTVRQMAREQNAAYWDWSKHMGGACGVNRWAKQGLAARDRIHLTSKGYRRSATAFAEWLMRDRDSNQIVALNQ